MLLFVVTTAAMSTTAGKPGGRDGGGWQRDLTDMMMGGTSAMFATLFTNPIEVVKTRLQLQVRNVLCVHCSMCNIHGFLLRECQIYRKTKWNVITQESLILSSSLSNAIWCNYKEAVRWVAVLPPKKETRVWCLQSHITM